MIVGEVHTIGVTNHTRELNPQSSVPMLYYNFVVIVGLMGCQ